MSDKQNDAVSPRLRGVLSLWFSRAKIWWGISLGLQISASLFGAISVLTEGASAVTALVVGLASVIGGAGIWRSEALRHRAESLLRLIELEDGFGWKVESKIIADSLAKAISVAAKAASREREQGAFYASSETTGARRALDNLRESAWWTQHLAGSMAWITGGASVIVGLMALWSLLVAATLIRSATPLVVSNVVTAVISLVFAGNLIRLPFDYTSLSASASESDQKASALVRAASVDPTDALRLLGDYQLKRAVGPLIPDWAWRLRRNHLNEIWRSTRGSAAASEH
jgi:hypothetical protein